MDFGKDPYPEYAWLRDEEPVRQVMEGKGLYGLLVTRYEDVRMLLTDPRMSRGPPQRTARLAGGGQGAATGGSDRVGHTPAHH